MRVVSVVALLLAAVALAGCGGDPHQAAPTMTVTQTASTDGVAALQAAYVNTFRNVSPSVVQIETPEGLGSGIVFDGKGDIVTNAHVVGTATTFAVTTASGDRLKGTLVGKFTPDDLAVIHASGGKLHPASFADSSKLQVGDIVMAIGNPLGFQSSVTSGIVSALGRTVPEPTGTTLPNVIQTSAPSTRATPAERSSTCGSRWSASRRSRPPISSSAARRWGSVSRSRRTSSRTSPRRS